MNKIKGGHFELIQRLLKVIWKSIGVFFLGAKAPLQIAGVSESVSQSQKKLRIAKG